MGASYNDYTSTKTTNPIRVLICDSGLVLRMKDVLEISLRPFEDEDKIVEKLKGIEDGTAMYMKTKKNGVQKLSLNNQHNLEYHYVTGSYSDHTQMMRRIIASWVTNQEED